MGTTSSTIDSLGSAGSTALSADANTQAIEALNAQQGANALGIAKSNAQMAMQQAMGDTIKNGASAMKDAAKAS